jgi:hypothetical protein
MARLRFRVSGCLSSWCHVFGPAPAAVAALGDLAVDGGLLDQGRLLPVIVPAGYFRFSPPARVPFLDGLDIAFGEDGDGIVGYTPAARLEAAGLTVGDAERIALENLCRRAQQGAVIGRTMLADDGEPAFILWGAGHWLSASSLLLPGLRAMAQRSLGDTEICAAIPHRDIMFLFGIHDQAWRDRMQTLITEKESDGRKPLTRRLIRLLDTGNSPYYNQPSFAYLE